VIEQSGAVWTVGHSRHEVDQFLKLLEAHGIDVIVDVRTAPYSRMAPQFNRESLRSVLLEAGIQYLHLGAELGGRPSEDHMYDERGHVFYNLVADTDLFKIGIERLLEGIKRFRAAVMCSEGDPSGCHRTLLVGRVLQQHGVIVRNVLPDGSEELLDDLNRDALVSTLFGEEEREWKSAVSVRQESQQSDSSSS